MIETTISKPIHKILTDLPGGQSPSKGLEVTVTCKDR